MFVYVSQGIVNVLVNVVAASVTLESCVTNAFRCPDVSMVTALSHLNVFVVPAGMVFSVQNVGLLIQKQKQRLNFFFFF